MTNSEQRRKQLARQKFERQRQRRATARRRARIRNTGIACGAALVLAAGAAYAYSGGLNGDDDGQDNQPNTAADETPSQAPDPCDDPAGGKPNGEQWKKEPAMSVDRSADYSMELETTCGDISVELDAENAPHTVNSFNFLAGEEYFDHTSCHRLVDGQVHALQCGDPKGTGQGGPGYTLPDENLKSPRVKGGTYPAGTVAMANQYNPRTKKGRDSGGSQFFLVFEDSELPPNYTPFGKVTGGMKTLKKIAEAGTEQTPQGPSEKPNATVVIDKATVRKS